VIPFLKSQNYPRKKFKSLCFKWQFLKTFGSFFSPGQEDGFQKASGCKHCLQGQNIFDTSQYFLETRGPVLKFSNNLVLPEALKNITQPRAK
jgi:hypothetical protein